MKKKFTFIAIITAAVFIAACNPLIQTDLETSSVTIDTGIDLPEAGSKAVPTGIVSFRLTVTAAGMITIEKTFTTASLSLDVNAGTARTFNLQAMDTNGNVLYTGTATKDLDAGAAVSVAITMGASGFYVTFDTNGGTAVASVFATADSFITAPAAPTKAGFTFAGWYSDAGLTTPWVFASGTVTAATTLYAKWTAVAVATYTVSFDSNGGTGISAISDVIQGSMIAEPAEPTLTGYTFAGWYEDNTIFSIPWIFDSSTVVLDLTLYAKWVEGYNVNFTTIGGATNGYAQDGDHGSTGMPLSIYFIGTTSGGTGYFQVYDVNGLSDPGVSGSDPSIQAYFKVCVFSGTFSMNSFMVYNPGGSDVSITVDGWIGASTHPPESGTPDITQIESAVAGTWTSINLSGFTALQNITINFIDNTELYFNQFLVY